MSSMTSPSAQADTTVYKLKNGMTVVIREDHFAPVVAEQIWVDAGGADEADIEAGVAHVHEHMLFKGTERRGVGEIASQVESSGGMVNAWTSWDQTVYHIVLASRFAGEGLDILADAVQHSTFDPAELKKELGVVMEEWKRSQDSPGNRIFHSLFGAAYDKHTYRRPVIGTEESITGLTREMILDFYGRFYAPNNMTLVVVGDVDTEETKARIEELFGKFEARDYSRLERPVEPPQTETRFATVEMEVKEAHLALGMHIVDANHPDAPVLDVLAQILDGGESARLYRRLIAGDQIATSASAFAYTPPDPGLFIFTAAFEADDELAVMTALLEEIDRVRREPVSLDELDRARANLESDFVFRRQTVQGQARELGSFVVVHNDPNYDETYLKALRGVTRADLLRVARQYLTLENLTVISLRPQGVPSNLDLAKVREVAQPLGEDLGPISMDDDGPTASKAKRDGGAVGANTEPQMFKLSNGVRLIVQEHHDVPVFGIRVATLGGLLAETPENNGISNFVADMLTRGTADRTHEELSEAVESLAGNLGGFSGRNSIGVAGSFLSEHFEEGLELTMEVLLRPGFRPEDAEKARRELLLAIKNREDDTAHQAFNLLYATVFDGHPYEMTTLGERESITSLSTEDLREFWNGLVDPSNLVVAVVGDVSTEAVVEKLSASLETLKDDDELFKMPPAPAQPSTIRRERRDSDRHQSHLGIGLIGIDVASPDRHALSVLETIMSRQGGRLFYELRDKAALAYSVTAFSSAGLAPGLFGAYIATDPENEEKAMAGLIRELDKVRNEDVRPEELERAQRYLIGTNAIGLQSNGGLAESMLFNELYGLGYRDGEKFEERISAITIEDVRRVAQKYLKLETRAEVTVGPKDD